MRVKLQKTFHKVAVSNFLVETLEFGHLLQVVTTGDCNFEQYHLTIIILATLRAPLLSNFVLSDG